MGLLCLQVHDLRLVSGWAETTSLHPVWLECFLKEIIILLKHHGNYRNLKLRPKKKHRKYQRETDPAAACGRCRCPGGWTPSPPHHLWSRSPTTCFLIHGLPAAWHLCERQRGWRNIVSVKSKAWERFDSTVKAAQWRMKPEMFDFPGTQIFHIASSLCVP